MFEKSEFCSPGKSDARGTAILFKNNFEFTVMQVTSDDEGTCYAWKS